MPTLAACGSLPGELPQHPLDSGQALKLPDLGETGFMSGRGLFYLHGHELYRQLAVRLFPPKTGIPRVLNGLIADTVSEIPGR